MFCIYILKMENYLMPKSFNTRSTLKMYIETEGLDNSTVRKILKGEIMKIIIISFISLMSCSSIVYSEEILDPTQCISVENVQYKEIPSTRNGMKSISWKAKVKNKCNGHVSAEFLTRFFDKDDFLVVRDSSRAAYEPSKKTIIYGMTRSLIPGTVKIDRADITIVPNRIYELRKSIKDLEALKHKRGMK